MDMWPLVLLCVQLCFCSAYEGKNWQKPPLLILLLSKQSSRLSLNYTAWLQSAPFSQCWIKNALWLCAFKYLCMHLKFLIAADFFFNEVRSCLRGGGGKRGEYSVHLGDVSLHRAQSVALMKALQLRCNVSPCLIFLKETLHQPLTTAEAPRKHVGLPLSHTLKYTVASCIRKEPVQIHEAREFVACSEELHWLQRVDVRDCLCAVSYNHTGWNMNSSCSGPHWCVCMRSLFYRGVFVFLLSVVCACLTLGGGGGAGLLWLFQRNFCCIFWPLTMEIFGITF